MVYVRNDLKELISPFSVLGKIIWKSSPIITILYLFIHALQSITPILQLLAVKYIIDAIVSYPETHKLAEAYLWVGIYILSLFIQTMASSLGEWFSQVLAERSRLKINQELLLAIDRHSGLDYYEDAEYKDSLETLRDSTGWLPLNLINFTTATISNVVSLVGIFIIIAQISPIIAFAIMLSSIPFAIKYNKFKEQEWDEQYELAPQRRKISYFRRLLMSHHAAKELKLFNNGKYFIDQYNDTFDLMYKRLLNLQKQGVKSITLTALISRAVAGIGYIWIVLSVGSGSLSPGDIALFLTSIFVLSGNLRESIENGALTIEVWRMGNDFVKFIADNQEGVSPSGILLDSKQLSIQFNNIAFTYPSNQNLFVLNDLSFTVNEGEKVAIVGENGSGKTTIVKLIANFYKPQYGEIKVNGQDIQELDVEKYRSKIAVVFQQFGKYALTVSENIGLKEVDNNNDRIAIINSAKLAGIDNYIKTFSQDYNTMLGRDWNGTELSGGQWQKIAIARGYFREADLIILDEPTAALDVRSEYDMYKNFSELTKDKTTIIISHRFSTVRMADKILVLNNGRIIEQGNHEQLMALNQEYAEMYRKQATSFKKEEAPYG